MEDQVQTVVIGAGQAGLAAGHHLRRRGERFAVLDAAEQAGGSWPGYYESLELFSPARHSALPGTPFPGEPGRYPHRDEVVAYLRDYAREQEIPVVPGARVTSVERGADGFVVRTAGGARFEAQRVVDATGSHATPHRPALPGLERFAGTVLHSAEYKAPHELAGQRVIVVGGGNSAVQIAVELAEASQVTLATRSPVQLAPQRPGGVDVHDWLVRSGIDRLPLGHRLGVSRTVPVLDDGRYRAALAQGRPDRRPMFTAVEEQGVVWSDGTREDVDVLLLATGFRAAKPHLVGVAGALRDDGTPRHSGGLSPVPGLGYVGLEWQRGLASATLRGVGRDAAFVLGRLGR